MQKFFGLFFAPMLAASVACAAHAEEHNFVNEDLTWHAPDPLPPGQYRYWVYLVDTKSVNRSGDTVTFDELRITQMATGERSSHTAPIGGVIRYQASCGWRTLSPVDTSHTPLSVEFLGPTDPKNRIVDAACAGVPIAAAVGAKSVAEAIAFWKGHMPVPSGATVLTIRRVIQPPPPSPWMGDGQNHRFVLETPDDSGNMLFVDLASISRDNGGASAQFLVVLSERAQRHRGEAVSIQKAEYDCSARAMIVVATGEWNVFAELVSHDETPFSQRRASESPVVAANIQAVCDGSIPTTQGFHSVNEAWAYQRSTWSPPGKPN